MFDLLALGAIVLMPILLSVLLLVAVQIRDELARIRVAIEYGPFDDDPELAPLSSDEPVTEARGRHLKVVGTEAA